MIYNVNRAKGADPADPQDFLCPDPVEAQARHSAKLTDKIKSALGVRRQ